ncbi:protein kinase domain-containing protein [Aquipuribacter nitratireducens]|uniref:non-specific serine/threonine protein kinase n=1 Tax=Aquipuribacter nitratireducens TaxID=650104 RepID=A0ABW0GNH1_9MICO
MSAPGPGRVLAGRYRLLDQVAVGAMGEVWRAHDDRLDRDVAVKVLRPELADDAGFLERFRGEARHAASVRHPHVAAVHDYGEDGSTATQQVATAYLVMDLLDGRPLSEVLAERGPLPAVEVAALLAQVADALAAAHRIGLVHRDVKPANLVESDGHVCVTDFGIARAADAVPVTRTGLVMGTAEYLSPEQARGQRATTASDVYSLGVVAYELLSGQPPFTGSAADVARAHVHDPVPALPGSGPGAVPAGMRATVARCLRKDPAQRPDVTELAERLRALGEGRGLDEPGSGGWAEDRPTAPARSGAAGAAAGGAGWRGPGGPAPRRTPPEPARPSLPPTRPVPVVEAPGRTAPARDTDAPPAVPPVAHRVVPRRPPPRVGRRPRRALRPPLVALIALVALLLLVTLLRAFGLLDGGLPDGADAAATHDPVTRSLHRTHDEDGR